MKDTYDGIMQTFGQAALAFFGGLIGALMRREASTWQTAMLGALGAGFVGLLVAKLCHATGVSDDMTFVFVGVSGWLGAARTIDYLERLLEDKIGMKLPHIEPEPTAQNTTTDHSGANSASDQAPSKEQH